MKLDDVVATMPKPPKNIIQEIPIEKVPTFFAPLDGILKGIIFIAIGSGIANFLDIIAGLYIAAASYSISHWVITSIVIIYLGQKAFISLL